MSTSVQQLLPSTGQHEGIHQHEVIASFALLELLRRANVFKFHVANLPIAKAIHTSVAKAVHTSVAKAVHTSVFLKP